MKPQVAAPTVSVVSRSAQTEPAYATDAGTVSVLRCDTVNSIASQEEVGVPNASRPSAPKLATPPIANTRTTERHGSSTFSVRVVRTIGFALATFRMGPSVTSPVLTLII